MVKSNPGMAIWAPCSRRWRYLALVASASLADAACSESTPPAPASGSEAAGGSVGGRSPAAGAPTTSAGMIGAAGAKASGGVSAQGGASARGGTSSLAGAPATGGNSGGVTSGGSSAAGGVADNGGATNGGKSSMGGSAAGGTPGESGAGAAGESAGGATGTGGATGPTVDTELDGLIGFATVNGYGVATTIGAGKAVVVRVTDFADFVAAVKDAVPRIVEVSGTITGTGVEMVDVGSNKTIIGIGSNATIDGFGLDINGWTEAQVSEFGTDVCAPEHIAAFPRVSNVIVRNLNFTNVPDDGINVQCYSHHVWVDHNTFQSGYDGSVDVKRGSDLVTVSWNRFVSTDKTMLLGHSEDNGAQDRGFLRVTYHHNFFDNTNTRTPRVRFGYAHVFNNYLSSTDYFLGLGIEAKIYAEANFVEKAKTLTQTFTESADYHLTWAASNHYDPATITRANDSDSTMSEWLDDDGSVQKPSEYPYTADSASSIASSVRAGAGAGKL